MTPQNPHRSPPPRRRRGSILPLLLLAVAPASCTGGSGSEPVILVTIDTLSADRVGAYGCPSVRTPHLDRLARAGLQVIDAVSPAPITLPSHSTILTGVDPPFHGVRDNGLFRLPEEASSLPELLPESVPTAAFVASFPLHGRFGLGQGFDLYDDAFAPPSDRSRPGPPERRADAVFDRAADWLLQKRSRRDPFVWTHVFDPHAPYRPPRPYAAAARTLDGGSDHDGEVAFVDQELGRFLRRVRTISSPTVIVVADHGESLGAHDEETHSIFVYDVTQRVPLMLVGTDVAPRLETRPRRLVDIAPTVLSRYGVASPPQHAGIPLDEPPEDDEAYVESMYPQLMRGWSALHGVRTRDWKYIRAPRSELYDLRRDPGERTDVSESYPGIVADLSERLDAILADAAAIEDGAAASAGGMDAETAERLRSLGYVATIEPGSAVESRTDPKDGIHVVVAIGRGQVAWEAREFETALGHFLRAVELDSEAKEAHSFLAGTYYELGRYEESVAHAKESLRLPPHVNEGPVRATLGQSLLELGRASEALPQLNAALAQRPNDARLERLIAEAERRMQ